MRAILFISILWCLTVQSADFARQQFEVKVYDRRVVVVSPEVSRANMNVLIENKTLITLLGKFQKKSGEHLMFITLPPDTHKVYTLPLKEKERAVLIPLSPAFQEIELITGKSTYEIPPQR
jgi:hypothetical protein